MDGHYGLLLNSFYQAERESHCLSCPPCVHPPKARRELSYYLNTDNNDTKASQSHIFVGQVTGMSSSNSKQVTLENAAFLRCDLIVVL